MSWEGMNKERRALLVFALYLGSASSLTPTDKLFLWRTPAAFGGDHAATHVCARQDEPVHLSRYCGDGTVFPSLGSRTQAKLAAHRGQLLVNGAEARAHTRVGFGDVLTLQVPPPAPMSPGEVLRVERLFHELTEARPAGTRLQVLYEDHDFAVVNKPPGIHSTSWAGTQRREYGRTELCLSDVLPLLLTPPPAGAGDPVPLPSPLPAHRLDARVAGVIAVAKTRRALAGLSHLFASRAVTKVYRAIVAGEVRQSAYACEDAACTVFEVGIETGNEAGDDATFQPRSALRIEQLVDNDKLAITELRVLSVTKCGVHGVLTTVDLRPLTGRRHQLRTACSQCCGVPIIGDDLYHDDANTVRTALGLPLLAPPVRRKAGLFLQALELAFPHPVTGNPLVVTAPEMERFEKLRTRAASGAVWTDAEWVAWRAL